MRDWRSDVCSSVLLAGRLASDAAEHGWSVREVQHRAQQFAAGKLPATSKKTGAGKARQQADIAALETELSESLGTRVSVVHGRSGKGRLVIHYSGLDTLDGVLERLRATTCFRRTAPHDPPSKIGRAWGRGKGCQYV